MSNAPRFRDVWRSNAFNFIRTHYGVAENIPHVCLSMEKEVRRTEVGFEWRPIIFSSFEIASALPGRRKRNLAPVRYCAPGDDLPVCRGRL